MPARPLHRSEAAGAVALLDLSADHQTQPTGCAAAALDYRQRGLAVIPISPESKTPLVAWKRFQLAPADVATISKWFEKRPDANAAIVTGAVSGLVVLDADTLLGTVNLARMGIIGPIWSVLTPKGSHLYLAHPGIRIPTRTRHLPGFDVKGDGGYVLAPPSRRPTGEGYEWWDRPEDSSLSPIPPAVLALLLAQPCPKKPAGPIPNGTRNATLYRLGRALWAKGGDGARGARVRGGHDHHGPARE